jgi:serine protease inhibitor
MEKSADYEMAWFRSFMTMIKDSIQEAHPELDLDESSFWQNTYSVMAKGTQNDKPYARKLIEFDLQSDAETILATILTWYQKDLQEDLEDILMTHGFNTEHDSPSGNPEHIHMRGVFPEDLGPYEI